MPILSNRRRTYKTQAFWHYLYVSSRFRHSHNLFIDDMGIKGIRSRCSRVVARDFLTRLESLTSAVYPFDLPKTSDDE